MPNRNTPKKNTGAINPKHYVGKTLKKSSVNFAAFVVTFVGMATALDKGFEPDMDTTKHPEVVKHFQGQLADLKTQKAELHKLQMMSDAKADVATFQYNAKTFLKSVIQNADGTDLSEQERMQMFKSFDKEVGSLKAFNFTALNNQNARYLDEMQKYDFKVKTVRTGQALNKSVDAEYRFAKNTALLTTMVTMFIFFPSSTRWEENRTLNRWANEQPRKPKKPRYKH